MQRIGCRVLASAVAVTFLASFSSATLAQSALDLLPGTKTAAPGTDVSAAGGGPAPAGGDGESSPARPKPIAIALLAREAENARLRLDSLREALAPGRSVSRIESALPLKEAEVDRLFREFQAQLLGELSPVKLEDLQQTWARLEMETGDWEEVLEGATKTAEEDRAQVRTMSELWTSTLLAATEASAPVVVLDRIGEILSGASETAALFKERMDALLLLQDRVARLRGKISDALRGLQKATLAAEQQLFEIESAPLWKAVGSPQRSVSVLAEIRESWRRAVRDIGYFARHETGRLWISLLLFFALSVGIVALRKRGGPWLETSDPSAAAARTILTRPIASSALISIIVSLWLYVAPPVSLLQLSLIAVLIPFFRLLPGLVSRGLHPSLYGLAALWLLERIRELALAHSLLQRLLLLLVAALGLAGLVGSLRPGGPARSIEAGSWWKTTLLMSHVAAVLLAISIVCNLVGNVTLAERLTRATLGSAFLAVLLYAAVVIVESMVAVALHPQPAARRLTVRKRSAILLRRWKSVVRLIAAISWAVIALRLFHVWEPAIVGARAALARRWTLGSIDISLGDVASFAVALAIAIVVAKALRALLDDAVLPGVDLPRGVPAAISKTAQYLVIGVGIVVASMAAGLEMSRFAFLAGALGVGIGFGLQNVVNNFISGIILLYERPIHENDVIEVGKVMGLVRRIGIRSSTVRTFDGAEVIVPNANLLSSEVVNWTLSDRASRAELKIGVAYGTDPRRVIEVLTGVVKNRKDVLSDPAPVILFAGLGSSSLDFALRFWTADFDTMLQAKSAVLADVLGDLGDAGIEIPFPQQDLHLRSVDPAAAEALRGAGNEAT